MYETPKITEVGDLHDVTLAIECSGDDDHMIQGAATRLSCMASR